MSEHLKAALIGCGEIASITTECIKKAGHIRVVQCMDIREELARDLAKVYGAVSTGRLEDVLNNADVQAVIVSVPHYQHAPLSIAAARAGKHVLVEKPIACTLGQADEMIAAAAGAGVRLGVFHPTPFGFQTVKARQLVRGGAIGDVVAVKLHETNNKPDSYWHGGFTGRVKDDWRISLATSGGGYLIMNQIHNLSAMIEILDAQPERIYAEYGTFRTPVEVEDFISFVMRLKGGAIVSLDGSSAAPGRGSFGDHIYGTKGQIDLGKPMKVTVTEPWGDLKVGVANELSPPEDFPDARAAAADAFAMAVLEGREVPVPGLHGRRALEIVRGAYLSMRQGRPVTFPVRE
jgi:predicted dehydrogenase